MGSIDATLGVNTAPYKKGLKDAKADTKDFKKSVEGSLSGLGTKLAGGLAGLGIGAFFSGIIDRADEIADLGDRFEVPVEALQRIGLVAEQNGSSLEGVAGAMNKLIIAQDKALGGDQALRDSFEELGITLEDLRSMGPDELMAKIGQGSMKATPLIAVMGKAALELRNTLAELKGAAPSGIISAEDVKRMAQLKDDASALWADLQAAGALLIGPVIESARGLVELTKIVGAGFQGMMPGGEGFAMAAARELETIQKKYEEAAKEKPKFSKSEEGEDQEAAKKAADLAKKDLETRRAYTEELLKLQDDIAQKEREAGMAALSFAQRRVELEKEIAVLKERQKNADPRTQASLRNQVLDKEKALKAVIDEQEKEKSKLEEEKRKADEQRQKLEADKARADRENKEQLDRALADARIDKNEKKLGDMKQREGMSGQEIARAKQEATRQRIRDNQAERKFVKKYGKEALQEMKDRNDPVKQAEAAYLKQNEAIEAAFADAISPLTESVQNIENALANIGDVA